jgi:hypothetical protein
MSVFDCPICEHVLAHLIVHATHASDGFRLWLYKEPFEGDYTISIEAIETIHTNCERGYDVEDNARRILKDRGEMS